MKTKTSEIIIVLLYLVLFMLHAMMPFMIVRHFLFWSSEYLCILLLSTQSFVYDCLLFILLHLTSTVDQLTKS